MGRYPPSCSLLFELLWVTRPLMNIQSCSWSAFVFTLRLYLVVPLWEMASFPPTQRHREAISLPPYHHNIHKSTVSLNHTVVVGTTTWYSLHSWIFIHTWFRQKVLSSFFFFLFFSQPRQKLEPGLLSFVFVCSVLNTRLCIIGFIFISVFFLLYTSLPVH